MKNLDFDVYVKLSLFKLIFFMNVVFWSLGVNFKYYVCLFVFIRLYFLYDGMICLKELLKL